MLHFLCDNMAPQRTCSPQAHADLGWLLRNTSVALANTESSIENTIRVAFEEHDKTTSVAFANAESSIKVALAENQKILREYICNKINDVNEFTMNEIEGMNAQVSILLNMMKEINAGQEQRKSQAMSTIDVSMCTAHSHAHGTPQAARTWKAPSRRARPAPTATARRPGRGRPSRRHSAGTPQPSA